MSRGQILLLCAGLFGLVVWTFLPAVNNGFVNYDDDVYVTGNAHVQEGLSLSAVGWAFASTDASNWHPLAWLSHQTDCTLFGLNPRGHHLTSVLVHAVNAVLLFFVLRRMTGSTWRSFFVAAVFGLHPLRVESVAWISERKDVLSMLFGLLAMLKYVEYTQRSQTSKSRARFSYGLALLFYTLSLMSKPMLVTLPFLLLLLDSWPLERFKYAIAWKLVWEKSPFFLLAVASCIVTFLAQKHGGAMVLMAQMSSAARMENALVSYGRYLGKLIWPENLAVLYPVVDHWPMHIVLLSAAVLLVASTASIATRRTHPYLATGWFWFLGTLVPVIGLVAIGEQAMADRYTYFPAIGILIMFAWGVEELTRGRRFQPQVTTALSVAILTGCILSTRQNIGYWKSSESLFRHVIAVTDNNYSAHCSLGNALLTEGRTQDALTEFQAALKLKPDSPENHCNLGVALANLNRMEEAIEEFQAAVKLQSNYGLAHHNLGMAFEQKGQLESATKEYQVAVKLMPTYVPARNSLGIALAKQGQLDAAVIQFREAVRLDPSFLPAQRNLKQALDLIGH